MSMFLEAQLHELHHITAVVDSSSAGDPSVRATWAIVRAIVTRFWGTSLKKNTCPEKNDKIQDIPRKGLRRSFRMSLWKQTGACCEALLTVLKKHTRSINKLTLEN